MVLNAAINSTLVRRETESFRDGRQQGHVGTGQVEHNWCLLFHCTLWQGWETNRAGKSPVSGWAACPPLRGASWCRDMEMLKVIQRILLLCSK